MDGVAIVGAGRIGVPWAAVLAVELDVHVTCVDIDEERVRTLNRGEAPFSEPELDEYLEKAVATDNLRATTDAEAVSDCQYVAFTLNAPRNEMSEFLDTVAEYAPLLYDGHIVINRATLPVGIVRSMQETIEAEATGSPEFTVFPERLAEGKAIQEIKTLPKVIGVDSQKAQQAIQTLLDGLACELKFTDPERAMFVKLIDNTYRDALFAISNQIAYTADQLGLDAHEAIAMANHDYPRNNIPTPGTVGGKCLPKDPHFLTDERVCDQPTTPDLFTATRRTNASLASYAVTRILRLQPSRVAVLGLSYKRGVGDTYNSPAKHIHDELASQGIAVTAHDPHARDTTSLDDALTGADTVVLAVNHAEFDGVEPTINDRTVDDAVVFDLWGALDRERLDRTYDGFGVAPST